MKALSELGISPAPWTAEDNLKSFPLSSCSVRCDAYDVAQNVLPSDARLIAAAPELYLSVCDLLEIFGNIGEYIGIDCGTIEKIGNAKAALAKAAGEEVAND